ncbi:uncharacterized protein MONOS_3890 [Monocercomonoides exilis]|uniref:uncharacterized protein n=1 Tax=Monocercomonoides exilis TaxID=2049356 RepID=UPI00355A7FCB|nr:hypothetical protein MONOS_3890 [Monocercomonoides exilis]|eukprot:MONOS_3890.1-p1 / transcript=MONOS_3890.1 / gene=MONOS_3890 / organism=Monocercomonoides_exilis_PA203 / gene_product=unspecified product / transcript_product=unspecified product / location=Mono_scaffold00096:40857-42429(-) / protein_length=446 / sequence_SO=supercontig / SO=protein_coding / is_pseudo=false
MEEQMKTEPKEASLTVKYTELQSLLNSLVELKQSSATKQKVVVEKMDELMKDINQEEFTFIFTTEMMDKIDKMIEEKKITLENALWLLKCVGQCEVLKILWNGSFYFSLLCRRFERMIVDEDKKKKEDKNEKLMIDLCECYMFHYDRDLSEILPIILPCVLNVALKKEESEETLKEVEIALLAISCTGYWRKMQKELYLNEIKEIVQYHQEHHNLTPLAYQSTWKFLITRLYKDKSLSEVFVNELHFSREAARELEEPEKHVDWKIKENEMKKTKEVKEISKWIEMVDDFFEYSEQWNDECVVLVRCLSKLCVMARENFKAIVIEYCEIFSSIICSQPVLAVANDVLKGGVFDFFMEELCHSTVEHDVMRFCLNFFYELSETFKEYSFLGDNSEEWKQIKRMTFKKMEEKGYESLFTSFYGVISFMNHEDCEDNSLHMADYFVNA